ncbi:retrovirus-related pol polyprotein from transposon TNT 1-94 [Tanacetum coccineum]|uniref:Retrovirus-related pol polyprotein from transposon TNT 1-94 n=1 Tax=Tanacetum coccineum TaxID=301880 RepID=A0ABQ4YYQ7_9ASTR
MHRFKKMNFSILFTRIKKLVSLSSPTFDNTGMIPNISNHKSMITDGPDGSSNRTSSWKSNHAISKQDRHLVPQILNDVCSHSREYCLNRRTSWRQWLISAWIEAMPDEHHQVRQTKTSGSDSNFANKARLMFAKGYAQNRVFNVKISLLQVARLGSNFDFVAHTAHKPFREDKCLIRRENQCFIVLLSGALFQPHRRRDILSFMSITKRVFKGVEIFDQRGTYWKCTCFVRDLKENDLLMGTRRSDLYTIAIQESSSPTPICFITKASPTQSWLWHRRLSHLNLDTINLLSKNDIVNGLPKLKYVKDQLCSSCEIAKAKRSNFKTKSVSGSKGRLHLLHMDLCGPMRVESINGKKYILVIVDDYSRYTWTHFLRSKDETPEVLIDSPKMIQWGLQAQAITVHTYRGTVSMFDEYFNGGNQDVSNSSATFDNQQKDATPQLNVQTTSEPSTPTTNVNAEENNIQAGRNLYS